jgi:apolipoprotein D and lipocalin family protein
MALAAKIDYDRGTNSQEESMIQLSFKTSLFALSLAIATLAISTASFAMGPKKPATVQTIKSFDLNQYLGTWYEIGSVPQSFSEGCVCTKADYSLKTNGEIRVLNTCRNNSVNGTLRSAEGRARTVVADEGKLEVSFFGPFFGEYWVTELGNNYDYSVVSNRDGSSLWILSRSKTMPQQQINEILARAAKNTIKTSTFKLTQQVGCPVN